MKFKEMIKKFIEEHKEYYENNFPLYNERDEAIQSGALGVLEELEDEIKEFEDKEINNEI
ncbi:hypothetical protein [Fusobacterium nucleatum]|uniref:hypothetical protein n=1 Tax=Fusobacterium nucleatum TaxID=851 RepID=UPI0030CB88F9